MSLSPIVRKAYPSDLTPAQFEAIRPELEAAIKKTCPRKVDIHEIFNAVAYVVKTGCQWRQIPNDLPHWRTAYGYFQKWQRLTDAADDASPSHLDLAFLKSGIRIPLELGTPHGAEPVDRGRPKR